MKRIVMDTQEERACKEESGSFVPELLILLSTVFFGLSFILVKLGLDESGPLVFTARRCWVALPLFLALRPGAQWKALTRESLAAGIALGLLLFAIFTLQIIGLSMTTASHTSLLTGLYVIILPILAWLFLGDRISMAIVVGVLLSLAGSVILVGGAPTRISTGDILVMISTIFIALHMLAIQILTKRYDPLLLTTLQTIVLGVLSQVVSVAVGEGQALPDSVRYWLFVGITATLVTFASFLIQSTMQKRIPAAVAGLIYATEGFWGVLFAWWIGGEGVTWRIFAGGVGLFAGILAAEYPRWVGQEKK